MTRQPKLANCEAFWCERAARVEPPRTARSS
jgi:hypothetical protein